MVGEPWTNAVLVVQMLARKLVDLILVLELIEADLAVLSLNNVRPIDDS